MSKTAIIYWSGTGNTEAMAMAVADGAKQVNPDAALFSVSDITADAAADYDVLALGCPAMGAEVLEEAEMEPFVCDVEGIASGKTIALFGSYGWGDGQWMRDWVDRMNGCGANVLNGEGLICQETPDADCIAECESLGKQLAQA